MSGALPRLHTPEPGAPCATCGEPAGTRDRCDVCGATVVEASAHLRASRTVTALPRSYARAIVLVAVSAAAIAVAAGRFLGTPPTPVHGGAAHSTR